MRAWVVWILAALTYFHQYFLRVSVGSLSGYLMHDFSLTMLQLSDLAVLFFISYLVVLPISGILIDRFGVRRMMPLASLLSGAACILFSYSTNDIELNIARLAMGAGAAFSLIGAQTIIRIYFPGHLFSILSALTLTLGVLGAIGGGVPLILASSHESWQLIMKYAGYCSLILALLLFTLLDKQTISTTSQYGFKKLFADFNIFIRTRRAWLPGVYGGLMLTPIIAFASFWAAPYLMAEYHYGVKFSEFLAAFVFIGYAFGSPIHSILAQKFGLKLVMICSSTVAALTSFLLVYIHLSIWLSVICLLLLGITVGSFVLTMVITRLSTPADIAASAFSFNTLISQLVGAGILWGIGQFLYGLHRVEVGRLKVYPIEVLHHAMHLLIAASFLAVIIACLIKIPSAKNAKIDS
ncbi:MFS transporter [Legionella cardiaca]|uniref:Lysosomal dipeptide transporter MFSD1 n=1 Tax=Legionella cardiaca TaxID=1071983 RepID=A0ABY8AY69_9GAMM|nr:MFS transporter [Legionella cardiaca]WED44097.1 MFS transporter [Legionella cardiaca]